jgi:hypothetical protein
VTRSKLFRLLALLTCLLALPLSPAAAAPKSWRVVMIAGDSSAPVFDNAVSKLSELLAGKKGVELRPLTSDGIYSSDDRPLATAQSIDDALGNNLAQGCLVFMTSHGTVDGLYLRHDIDNDRMLSPGRLDRILDKRCGDRPTVIVASACHSGVFIGKATKGDNRIILTAARDDRVSFGCGADFEYTYFDECLLKAWPKGGTWQQLFDRTTTCVRLKESELSEAPSMPQAFFGKNVKDLQLP